MPPCRALDSPFLYLGWGKGDGGIGAYLGDYAIFPCYLLAAPAR